MTPDQADQLILACASVWCRHSGEPYDNRTVAVVAAALKGAIEMEQIIEIDEHGKVHGNDLEHALASALNRFSAEGPSNTPDWILAQFLLGCLAAWNQGVQQRAWYGRDPRPTHVSCVEKGTT